MVNYGQALKAIREERGMTQQQFADMLGLHHPAYWRIEHGQQRLLAEHLFVISVRLGIPLSQLEARLLCKIHRQSGMT